jgi:hypothetical protein
VSHRGTDREQGCLTDCPPWLWPPQDGTFYGPDWIFLWPPGIGSQIPQGIPHHLPPTISESNASSCNAQSGGVIPCRTPPGQPDNGFVSEGTNGCILFGLGSKMGSFGNFCQRAFEPNSSTAPTPVPAPHIKYVASTPFGSIIRPSLDGVEHDRQCRGCHLHRWRNGAQAHRRAAEPLPRTGRISLKIRPACNSHPLISRCFTRSLQSCSNRSLEVK